ncbi:hypothetical protein PTSG_04844 [Salpingoeca rosetta]|uniref:PDZ domain-containing protein n=1 Tax=Salpingoeca rosetta (strain ATCC 50818 / BSB-021) TaxID=946362 RepID=F2U9V4_SALR5|nr:uncharacterized protein PTSG_04844 [Salpingoeca rosetta]EGD73131.1 hypothetical protein PTSG_04844 [Salpingoeca rosetta]|eukprot:XP_004994162.1 hypothetical protein PTSG_04844 [Salpingoeca rosetta]
MALLPYPRTVIDPFATESDTLQLTFELRKSPRSGLGVTITGSNSGYDGLYVADVPRTSSGHGRLRVGDRLIRIDGFALAREHLSDTDALRVIQDRLFDDSSTVRLTVLRSPLVGLRPNGTSGASTPVPTMANDAAAHHHHHHHHMGSNKHPAAAGERGGKGVPAPHLQRDMHGTQSTPSLFPSSRQEQPAHPRSSTSSTASSTQQQQQQHDRRHVPVRRYYHHVHDADRHQTPGLQRQASLPIVPRHRRYTPTANQPVFGHDAQPHLYQQQHQYQAGSDDSGSDSVSGSGVLAVGTPCRMCATARTMYGLEYCSRHATDPEYLDSVAHTTAATRDATLQGLASTGRAYLHARSYAHGPPPPPQPHHQHREGQQPAPPAVSAATWAMTAAVPGTGQAGWEALVAQQEQAARYNMMMFAQQQQQQHAGQHPTGSVDMAEFLSAVHIGSQHEQHHQQYDQQRFGAENGGGAHMPGPGDGGAGGGQLAGDDEGAEEEEEEEEEEGEDAARTRQQEGGAVEEVFAEPTPPRSRQRERDQHGGPKQSGESDVGGVGGVRVTQKTLRSSVAAITDFEIVDDSADVSGLREFRGVAHITRAHPQGNNATNAHNDDVDDDGFGNGGRGDSSSSSNSSNSARRRGGRSRGRSAGPSRGVSSSSASTSQPPRPRRTSGEQGSTPAWQRDTVTDPDASNLLSFLSEMTREREAKERRAASVAARQHGSTAGGRGDGDGDDDDVVGDAGDGGHVGAGDVDHERTHHILTTSASKDDSAWADDTEPVFTF